MPRSVEASGSEPTSQLTPVTNQQTDIHVLHTMCHLYYVAYTVTVVCTSAWAYLRSGGATRKAKRPEEGNPSEKTCWGCKKISFHTAQTVWDCESCGAVNEPTRNKAKPDWRWLALNYIIPAMVAGVIAVVWVGGHIVQRDAFEALSRPLMVTVTVTAVTIPHPGDLGEPSLPHRGVAVSHPLPRWKHCPLLPLRPPPTLHPWGFTPYTCSPAWNEALCHL